MKYRTLGKTGFKVSEIGFGAWAIGGGWGSQDDSESLKALHTAIDNGVNFLDTAAGYGGGRSEKIIAQVIKERKEELVVATKTPPTDGIWPPSPYCKQAERYSEAHLRANIEERLRFLDVEALDVLQLHTWTRAWNKRPEAFEILGKLKQEGKVKYIGVSTPEPDQNAVIQLMREGWVDTVQVIYNLLEQAPAAELLPAAQEHNVGIIVRVALDEGALTGKFSPETTFPENDFRSHYFSGDRLARTLKRVEPIKEDIAGTDWTMPNVALKFALSHPAVSTVIAGIRNVRQAEMNTAVPDLPEIEAELMTKLQRHNWHRGNWHEQ